MSSGNLCQLVTDALKKKGLRRSARRCLRGSCSGDRCPEEEGIKTSKAFCFLLLTGDRCPEEEGIKTACFHPTVPVFCTGDRCPEEEGIKTEAHAQLHGLVVW